MSIILARQVWESALPADLKLLALYLAYLADEDGHRVYPSVARIAERTSRSESWVHEKLARLRRMKIIVVTGNGKGGRKQFTVYRFCAENLPFEKAEKAACPCNETVSNSGGFHGETVPQSGPFSQGRVSNGGPFPRAKTGSSSSNSEGCDDDAGSHPLDLPYPLENNYPGMERAKREFLSEVIPWVKATWKGKHPNKKFPTRFIPETIQAESRMGKPAFQTEWEEFLSSGQTDVRQFLRGQAGRSQPRYPFESSAAVPAGHSNSRRKTVDEIGLEALENFKRRQRKEAMRR